jgi:hypothetical protein
MLMVRNQKFDKWLSIVSKQLEILYEVDLDTFMDTYDFQDAYDSGKATRFVVEELALIIG